MPKPLFDERTKSLWQVGFFSPLDFILLALIAAGMVTAGFWRLFGEPTFAQLACVGAVLILFFLIWIVTLVFRCMWFVIQLTASVKTMPASAARLVMAFSRGGELPPEV